MMKRMTQKAIVPPVKGAASAPNEVGAENQAWLREKMKARSITAVALGKAIGYSPETVRGWLCKEGTVRHRQMPLRAWILASQAVMLLKPSSNGTRGRPME